ncbi:hypothetical protein AGOR_G00119820 [Albula goreensis]|uniref:Uncharacterized protein n=1 Tax=Albula goreensis TaxID=1534307 RepID=A0A8T3DC18_9TELE|nr:hypothetical protein AGOR_G00119820 [Albula goreensis]
MRCYKLCIISVCCLNPLVHLCESLWIKAFAKLIFMLQELDDLASQNAHYVSGDQKFAVELPALPLPAS